MDDFESSLNQVCESVLSEVFCSNGNQFKHSGAKSTDCCRNPQQFDDALVDMFQPMGAILIETKILTRFYRSIGARYSRSGGLNFVEEIRKARLEFASLEARLQWQT